MTRRSSRRPALPSPLTLLDQVAPAHRAIAGAMAGVEIGGDHYAALERASDALHRLAAELGHPRRLAVRAPSATGTTVRCS